MSNTATLVYHATAAGPVVPATLEAAMAAVVLDKVPIETVTGATANSDVTSLAGSIATRTIIFAINTAAYMANFPAGSDQAAPFRGLYTQALSGALNTFITEDAVVIA